MVNMEIKVDAEGKKSVESLCDVALKTGGIQNLEAINKILKAMVLMETATTQPDKV